MGSQMDMTYQYIKDRILKGIFRPSQKLTETELVQQIGVSRNTIKKAFLKLEQENLIAIEKNKGATIKVFTLEEILNYMEIREVLEGLISRSAVRNISYDDLDKMRDILEQMKKFLANSDFDKYSENNKLFHAIIYASASNRQAVDMIMVIRTQLLRYQFRTILIPGRAEASPKEHTQIYEAFRRKDEDQVVEAVTSHISNVRKVIEQNYHFLV
jgi:DNA-binding GntR family transcriptional regulator